MSIGKYYPVNTPSHIEIINGKEVSVSTFKGCAVGILDHNDISTLEHVMEFITLNMANEKLGEEYGDLIDLVITNSKARILSLHNVLGAFDIGSNGQLTKPDSELIDWHHLDDNSET
jgi:hypothetical protein